MRIDGGPTEEVEPELAERDQFLDEAEDRELADEAERDRRDSLMSEEERLGLAPFTQAEDERGYGGEA